MKIHTARKKFAEQQVKKYELLFSKIEDLEKENLQLKRDLSHVFEEIYMIHREIHQGQYCPECKDLARSYMKEVLAEEER